MTLILSLIIATAVSTPWMLAGRRLGAGVSAMVSFLASMCAIYLFLPTTCGPLFGGVGFIAGVLLLACGLASLGGRDYGSESHKDIIPLYVGLVVTILFAVTAIGSTPIVRSKSYARLVPQIEERQWSADFQPKDPRHFRISSSENAQFLAGRAIGQATTLDKSGQPNAIGSQFKVYDEVSSVQIIKGELWTIVPLDWTSCGPQFSPTTGVPGYIKVSGENPIIPAEYVPVNKGQEFRYTPESIWGSNLSRLIWQHHMDKQIADTHLEIDDEGRPHYIASIAMPTIGWWGSKVIGALIIDPVTGSGVEKFIPLGEVPAWVDRVEAKDIIHRNIDYHGKYAKGFMNRSFYGNSVLAATETHFGYGSDGEPVFATGITAHNNDSKSDSLVAIYYTNTRTGKTVEYMLQGGATEEKALEQCNLIGDIRNKGYHGTTPQLYNVYGHISYVVPIQNATHAFAGVAIVSVMNPQIIAWGPNAHEAELAYKQVIVSSSGQMAIDGTRKLSTITGRIERLGSMLVSGSTTFIIQIEGMNHLLTVPLTTSAKIPVTKIGDTVWVEYYDSGETVMPVNKFDNTSLTLESSTIQQDVHERAVTTIDADRKKSNDRADINGVLEKLPAADKALIQQNLK